MTDPMIESTIEAVVEEAVVVECIDKGLQTTEIIDDMPLRYKNKAEELHKEVNSSIIILIIDGC